MNCVFSALEKNRVPNDMMLDYAMEFTSLKAFNGTVLFDSNYTDYTTLGDIYNTQFRAAFLYKSSICKRHNIIVTQ